jgi:hypothetical protein
VKHKSSQTFVITVDLHGQQLGNRRSPHVQGFFQDAAKITKILVEVDAEQERIATARGLSDIGKAEAIEAVCNAARDRIATLSESRKSELQAHVDRVFGPIKKVLEDRTSKSDTAQLREYFEGHHALERLEKSPDAAIDLRIALLALSERQARPDGTRPPVDLNDPIWRIVDSPVLAFRLARVLGPDGEAAIKSARVAREEFLMPEEAWHLQNYLETYAAAAASAGSAVENSYAAQLANVTRNSSYPSDHAGAPLHAIDHDGAAVSVNLE